MEWSYFTISIQFKIPEQIKRAPGHTRNKHTNAQGRYPVRYVIPGKNGVVYKD